MKLAFAIFRYFPFGGLQRTALNMALEAVGRGHQVVIFCGEWQGDVPQGIEVRVIRARVLFDTAGIAGFLKAFKREFVRKEFDLLVGFNKMPNLDVYYCGDSCFANKAYHERSFLYRFAPRSRLYLRNERAVFSCDAPTRIMDISLAERPLFTKFYATHPSRFHFLPPGIKPPSLSSDTEDIAGAIRNEFNIPATAALLLCVGSGFRTKGLDRSIACLVELIKKYYLNAYLLVVGADKSSLYKQLAQQKGVVERVIFAGGRSDMSAIYAAADLLLHPAYREVAGNVILEAMLAGLPVVATDVCGYSSYVRDYDMGQVVSAPYAAECLAKNVCELLRVDKKVWLDRAQILLTQADIFSRPARAVDFLESINKESSVCFSVKEKNEQIVLRQSLAAKWGDLPVFDLMYKMPGSVIRSMPGRSTLRFDIDGHGYYRKLHTGIGWKEILKDLICGRLPVLGAANEWYALNYLAAAGIPSLVPVAYGRRGRNPALQESFIVTEALEGCTKLDVLFTSGVSACAKRIVIAEVARIARELHRLGVNHRDFYLCHFLLVPATLIQALNGQGSVVIHLVDLHRAQLRTAVPERWLVKDLGGLLFSTLNLDFNRRDYYRFLKQYFLTDLRSILTEQDALLLKVIQRARATYRRDFGHDPLLSDQRK